MKGSILYPDSAKGTCFQRRKLMRKTGLFTVLAVLLAVVPSVAFGQLAGSASITGTVTDPSGSSVPGAAVIVRNTDTGIDRRVDTNDAGIYVAPFLQPGHYEVRVSKEGFAGVLQKDLTLQVGQTLTINFSLTLQTTT